MQQGETEALELAHSTRDRIHRELSKVIVGQEQTINLILTAILAQGHVLLSGAPGLAKTRLACSLAQVLSMRYSRIQFTIDLMPSDILGMEILKKNSDTGENELKFIKGPIFANFVLADEINRTPPKVQSALLEVMEEKCVTVNARKLEVNLPFFILATQCNTDDAESTYLLPQGQLDRFLFYIQLEYPSYEEEVEIVRRDISSYSTVLECVLTCEDVINLQNIVQRVPVADACIDYAVRLVRATRPGQENTPDFVSEYIADGASPRASSSLVKAAKARALLAGRYHIGLEDIRAVVVPVLAHRVRLNFNAEADGVTVEQMLTKLLESTSF